MRLLIKFNHKQKIYYRQSQLTGLVYSLIGQAGFGSLHDLSQKHYRLFNFSQLFQADGYLSLLFSSPFKPLAEAVNSVLKRGEKLNLNQLVLEIKQVKLFQATISFPIILKTETPVVIRIPKERYQEYGLQLSKWNLF